MGRTYLTQKAQEAHISLSQYAIRELLTTMERMNYVTISKGRGGTRITEKGLLFLEQQRDLH